MPVKQTTAKKYSTKPRRPRPAKAVPPPDNPSLRHEELSVDRVVDQEGQLPEAAAERGSRAGGSRRGARAGRAPAQAGTSEVKRTAELRLRALKHCRRMLGDEQEASPAVLPSRSSDFSGPVTAAPGAEPEMVAPVAGTSNWVQLGPTAIPKGQTYSSARPFVTGRVTSILVHPTDPQTIYVGSAQGGVWKTEDGGKNWVAKTDNEASLAIGALSVDPGDPLVLYAGTGEGNFSGDSYYGNGVLKTTDGGTSWTTLAQATFTGTRFSRIAVTPGATSRLFAATGLGVYRSTNGGVSWTKMSSGLPAGASATDVAIDSSTPTTVYAAFYGQGIYKTTNGSAATPTWTKLAGGLASSGFSRISLGVSPTSPLIVYALMADGSGNLIDKFFRTTNGGTNWTSIALPGGNIGKQGFYNINVAVDPTTPDIVFLSGVSVWKATRNSASGAWTITDVGGPIHPDNHAFAFDQINHLVVYAGNDGGIYKSTDGGVTWTDTVNEGLCITQFEFMADHPTSDAVIFCGTQDNGTEQFRNSPVFYHSDDGDGGYTAIDQTQPNNVLSTYYKASPKRSTQGGKFGTWFSVSSGIVGDALFYPPMAMDETNPNNLAFGTDRINLDSAQGTGGWPVKVSLPGMTGNVSAIHYVNSTRIYVGTTTGKVYKLTKSGSSWTATPLGAAPLPGQWIWDIAARPDDINTLVVVMSGFGISHVWRGAVPASGAATWTNISGSGAGTTLPDIPVNALAIDPLAPNTYYIATDVAVYRTTNGGATWTQFSQGLPNAAVFDMRLHNPSRLLRAATHGRGMWERVLDVASTPVVDIFVRDHLMDTGRVSPSPNGVVAAFDDPLQHVTLGQQLWYWMCADIKVDALEGSSPSYQMNVADVDYVAFESKLAHRNAQRGKVNRVYVQVHNRGIQPGASVVVKLLYANASAGLPPLPSDFWTAFPGNGSAADWKPIGAAKVIPQLSGTEPVVLEWDWATPATAADHSCLLVVIDCPANPIPAANKILNVDQLVRAEKRVGLKNLFVIDAPPGASAWQSLDLVAPSTKPQTLRVVPSEIKGGSLALLLPKASLVAAVSKTGSTRSKTAATATLLQGVTVKKAPKHAFKSLGEKIGDQLTNYDRNALLELDDLKQGGLLAHVRVPKSGLTAQVMVSAPASGGQSSTFSIVQEEDGEVVGGCTFVVRARKQ
jgi:photosystem II stability/assembly factor-like uncharacterized protein